MGAINSLHMKNNYKKNEKEYVSKLTLEQKKWLINKPFGDRCESSEKLRDFSHIIYILDLSKGSRILDLGVGSGWTSIFLAKMGYVVTGLDISPEMIKIASAKAKSENAMVDFRVMDIEKVDIHEKFDAILVYDTLHHCFQESQVIASCKKLLKDKGKILIVEPNYFHGQDPKAQKIAEKYGILEKGYFPCYLIKLLKNHGFSDIKRYYANSMLTKPYDNSFKETLVQIFAPLLNRLFFSHYKSQVWILAKNKINYHETKHSD